MDPRGVVDRRRSLSWALALVFSCSACSVSERELGGPSGAPVDEASSPLEPGGGAGEGGEPPSGAAGDTGQVPGEITPEQQLPGESSTTSEGTGSGSDAGAAEPVCVPAGDVEVCSNGVDDDCNGSIDETPPCIGYVSIAAGAVHTCALRSDGQVSCWGNNEFLTLGRLGAGDFPRPELVAGVSNAAQIELGREHSCVIRQGDSAVLCWGHNDDGQLGNGTTGDSATPVLVPGLAAARIRGSSEGTCAIETIAGQVRCWGQYIPTQGIFFEPTLVSAASPASEIASGGLHTCTIIVGNVVCWGANTEGQLGNGTTESSEEPLPVLSVAGAQRIASGGSASCVVLGDGRVQCWGQNDAGGLGSGVARVDQPTPAFVEGLGGVLDVALGFSHTCAILSDRTLACWGNDVDGQLGIGGTLPRAEWITPRAVPGLVDVRDLGLGNSHSCAVTGDGSAYCWGANANGQLGNGGFEEQPYPVRVLSP